MHALDPELLTDARTLAAYLIFIGSYFVFALGKFPWMKIDRPGAAIIGAVLMVAFRIVGARDALGSIDFPTIVLLFSMMLIVGNLRVVGFFDWITERLIERLQPHHLLPTVIFSSGLLSGVSRERRRLPRDDAVRRTAGTATSRDTGSICDCRGDRVEHRERRDHHGQSAEHVDRVALRHFVSWISRRTSRRSP